MHPDAGVLAGSAPLPSIPPGGHRLRFGSRSTTEGLFEAIGYSDGAIKKGLGTWGCVLKDSGGGVISEFSGRLSGAVKDSNVPELRGIRELLQAARERGVRRLVCLADSFQALQAISGAMIPVPKAPQSATSIAIGIPAPSKYPDVDRIVELLGGFEVVELRNVANRKNAHADALCARERDKRPDVRFRALPV